MNKSGTSGGVISLPKGGGALHGIGEKFSPDLHTGTGNFTVPIALPPGRNGFQPQLNLVYSTGTGNGPFGLGWNLSVPGISRKTSKGVPLYNEGADLSKKPDERPDVFILSGAEDLVRVSRQYPGRVRYRPRTEGLFALIEHVRNDRNDYWEVRSKDGLISRYGTPGAKGNDPAVIADPSDPADPSNRTKVFAWKLIETRDPFGNRIVYEYERDMGQEGPHQWDQLYLKHIRYVDYTERDFLVSVTFDYGDRHDPFSEYRSGFEIRTTKRCERIVIRTNAEPERRVRTYKLAYLDERVASGQLPGAVLPQNRVSLLSQIKVIGHDGGNKEELPELPPLEFGYTQFEPEKRKFAPLTGRELPARSLANPDLEFADLFGNGLPDILEMSGTVRYWRNLGGGEFDIPRPMAEAPGGLALAEAGVQLIDANGDGRTDLLITKEELSGYFPLKFGGLWDRKSFKRYEVAPSFNLEDPEVRLVDLDGDGVTDAIRSGTSLECFFNDPHKGWNGTRRVERQALEAFPNINFSDPRVKWADMSGDGLQDIVLVHDGNVEYWPNLGRGSWGKRIHMKKSPRFPYGYDPKRILVGDVDGDGLADLVYVDDKKVTLWINQSGNGWSDPVVIPGTPPVSDLHAVRLADVLGTGIGGVLWSADATGLSRQRLFFLDFTGGIKPYLLSEMDNHIGAITKVEYVPSTQFYLQDQKHPRTRWKTPLPFPVQVVARVEVIDDISKGKLTTEYRYHHGYWDGAEREFRGFGMVEQLDTESFEKYDGAGLHGTEALFANVDRKYFSPPTLTKTWFHQGPVGEEFGDWQEIDGSKEYWTGDPPLLNHTDTVNQFLRTWPPTPNGRRVKRDALRALRGSVLRTELYALDGSVREERPYTVTEYAYGLREEEPPGDPRSERLRIFFPHRIAQRTTQWERGDDPLTQFEFTADYDQFGQPRQNTTVALPRRSAKRAAIEGAVVGKIDPNEKRILATHTRTEYAIPDDGSYIVDRVAQVQTFEFADPPEMTESEPDHLARVLEEQASSARAVHDRFRDLLNGWKTGQTLPGTVHLIGHTVNHYDGEAFQGLSPGKVEQYGALTRSESLVFTDQELNKAYEQRRPTYMGGSAHPPAGAPENFGAELGYRKSDSVVDGYHKGYYADTKRQQFDFQARAVTQRRGMVFAIQDALGHQVDIKPDKYWLLPVEVSDPVKLKTSAEYDYRVMQPTKVTDLNGNVTLFTYTPLGLLHKQYLEGCAGEGGTLEKPEIEYAYGFLNYERRGEPIFVHATQRVCHAKEPNACNDVIESREYSDGFGRLVQKRTQAEALIFGEAGDDVGLPEKQGDSLKPAVGHRVTDRVVVSGWQIYDNKGRVVEKYEPFFDQGWEFQREEDAKKGKHASLFYDPRGQLIRTLNPDGSEQRVIFGIPHDLQDPHDFSPTPWESHTYDANDLAPFSYHPQDKQSDGSPKPLTDCADATHHCTPASSMLDALGRVICQVERNGSTPAKDWYMTRSRYDIRGNLLEIKDALGRSAFKHAYDLLNKTLRIDSIDAGVRTSVFNVAGNLVEYRDSKGSVVLREYDALNRLKHVWARDNDAPDSRLTLRERLEYGDGSDPNQLETGRLANKERNRLGRLYRHYDEAGLLQFDSYDFKGNITEKVRRVIKDSAITDGWVADWNVPTSTNALEEASHAYETSIRYDALNRPATIIYPADVHGRRAKLTPRYNRAGALEEVELDGTPYATQIAYNPKGQRVLIAYGNKVMTRYVYDPNTFRLSRLRAEKFQTRTASSDTWTGVGEPLQDFVYEYDLVGNITAIHDRAPNSGVLGTPAGINALDPEFTYDPLYRLLSATGRECEAPPPIPPNLPWDDKSRCTDLTKTRPYEQHYQYDPAGNMRRLSHVHIAAGNVRLTANRKFEVASDSNRLRSVKIGELPFAYIYDDNGNLVQETTERHFGWDHADRLITFVNQAAGSNDPSVEARYLYGADGKRIKKWVKKGRGDGESSVYIEGVFEYHRWGGLRTKENNWLHVMDNQRRIALVCVGDKHDGDGGPDIQYHLGDHLGSSNVAIGGDRAAANDFISREEYFPYGETSFGSFAKKRYRFTGKERDEESGLYYHGARYYAPWITRWISGDPIGLVNGINVFSSFQSNPLRLTDPTGTSDVNGTPDNPPSEKSYNSVPQPAESGGYVGGPLAYDNGGTPSSSSSSALSKSGFWDRGGRTLGLGLLTLGGGLILLASGPVGWGVLVAGTFAVSGGGTAVAWGATHLSLSYAGQLNEKQESEMRLGGEFAVTAGSPGGILGMSFGAFQGTPEGALQGGAIGSLGEAGWSLAKGFGNLGSMERAYGLTRARTWEGARPRLQQVFGYGDKSARVRDNPLFWEGVERIHLSHWNPQRLTRWAPTLFDRPWNLRAVWATEHALMDPELYKTMTQAFKNFHQPYSLLGRSARLMPEWARGSLYGAALLPHSLRQKEVMEP